jgi:hypothetical protein
MKADDEAPQAPPARLRTRKEVMNMTQRTGKNDQASRAKQLILGTKKHYPNDSAELTVGGATFKVNALTQLMQDFVDQRQAVEASKAVTRTKVETERTQAPSKIAVIHAFRDGREGNHRACRGERSRPGRERFGEATATRSPTRSCAR